MQNYPDDMKVKDALQLYFTKYHFKDGGYHDRYFRIKIGRVFIPVPNTKGRIDAVKMHDIHHILTGYPALWKGEVMIAGWELSSGCGKYYMAWILNTGSFLAGLFLYPCALYSGLVAGSKIKTNLYKGFTYDETLLNSTVGQVRKRLMITT